MKKIKKESIEFVDEKIFGDEKIHCYDCVCEDGVAKGKLADISDTKAPREITITYPKLSEILSDEDATQEVLEYNGLQKDCTAKDINYGDIMMTYGKIKSVA